MSTFIPTQHHTESPKNAVRPKKEIKLIQIGKEEKTVFVHSWHDCLHRKSQGIRKKKKKFLELKNNYSKVVEYKVNIQKSMAFLYMSMNSGIWNLEMYVCWT